MDSLWLQLHQLNIYDEKRRQRASHCRFLPTLFFDKAFYVIASIHVNFTLEIFKSLETLPEKFSNILAGNFLIL